MDLNKYGIFFTFQYGNAKIVIFYRIKNPLSISLSLPVIKHWHFWSIYDYGYPCQHWKADTDVDSTLWASGLFDDGDIINLSIFNKIFQGNTILYVKKCKLKLNFCLEQENSIVGFVQNGMNIVIKIHKTFM